MRKVFISAGFLAAITIHSALAASIAATSASVESVTAMQVMPDKEQLRAGKDSDLGRNARRRGEEPGKRGGIDAPSELELAAWLSTLEVLLDIKASQLDAWRDYTKALQSLLAPAHPHAFGQDPDGPEADAGPHKEDPFAQEQWLADELSKRAVIAERLTAAIATLRSVLTSEQLERLASANHLD